MHQIGFSAKRSHDINYLKGLFTPSDSINVVMTLVILFSLKSMESLQNGFATQFQTTVFNENRIGGHHEKYVIWCLVLKELTSLGIFFFCNCSPPKPSRSIQMVGRHDLHIPVSRSNLPSGPIIATPVSPLVISSINSNEFRKYSPRVLVDGKKRVGPRLPDSFSAPSEMSIVPESFNSSGMNCLPCEHCLMSQVSIVQKDPKNKHGSLV